MEAAPLVTLIATAVAVIVIALFLVTVTYQLHQVSSRLNKVLDDVAAVGDKTTVLDPVIDEIANDLAGAHAAIDGAVERLKERKNYVDENGATPTGTSTLGQPAPSATLPAGPPPTTFSA